MQLGVCGQEQPEEPHVHPLGAQTLQLHQVRPGLHPQGHVVQAL